MRCQRVFSTLFAAGVLTTAATMHAQSNVAGAEIFDRPTLRHITIKVGEAGIESLRRDRRKAVPALIQSDGREFSRVALHLKGGLGSVRPLDDKPALTLNFSKLNSGQRFFGLRKIHLNNSVQDPTYLCEDLAGELFRRAGVPAPRTAWATVDFNGRKLGLYVLKEGFAKEFLRLHFSDADGNLYDGGTHHEITEALELDSGDGAQHREDLRALASAAQAPAEARWDGLCQTLDVERFASFMAMEVLANDIDGYCAMQNNYRIYVETGSGRSVFLPHGMDRMFYQSTAPLAPYTKGLVAGAFAGTREGNAMFQRRIQELALRVFQPSWMTNWIDERVRLLASAEPLVAREAEPLKERIVARAAFIRQALRDGAAK